MSTIRTMAWQGATRRSAVKAFAVMAVVALGLGACQHIGHMMGMGTGAQRPADEEFGFGPRASAQGVFVATVDPVQAIKVGRMQTMRVRIADRDGRPVESAEITVDGGMPQHGHGLPTKPRVTRHLGGGVYEVEGMKFNMGGWWTMTFRVACAAGTDSVTFNIDL
jgi:hypothetical protein